MKNKPIQWKKVIVLILSIFLISSTTACAIQYSPQKTIEDDYVKGEMILVVTDQLRHVDATNIIKYYSRNIIYIEPAYKGQYPVPEDSDIFKLYLVHFPENTDIEKIADLYKNLWFVEFAEPNYIFKGEFAPSDPLFPDQWGLQKIQAHDAYDIEMGNEEIVIAILDTGVDLDHEDLINELLPGYDFVDEDEIPEDDHGHGTRITGIASATTNNGLGIASSCPECKILPLRVGYNDGGQASFEYYDILNALIYIKDGQNANVVSMSFLINAPISSMRNVISNLTDIGIYSVAAAGNDGNNIEKYPAAFDNVIAVAATDENDEKTDFSNYGDWVDIAAPGIRITTTEIGGGYIESNMGLSGTSFSTPFVSGLAGLILSINPELTFEEIRNILIETSDPVTGFPEIQGGRINSYRALLANHPPDLLPIEDIEVIETEPVIIIAQATDPNNEDILIFSINDSRFTQAPMPPKGNTQQARFTWFTGYYSAGIYEFEVTVTDGEFNDTKPVNVTVYDKPRKILPHQVFIIE